MLERMASTDLMPFSRVSSLQTLAASAIAALSTGFAVLSGFAFWFAGSSTLVKVWFEGPARLQDDSMSPNASTAPVAPARFGRTIALIAPYQKRGTKR